MQHCTTLKNLKRAFFPATTISAPTATFAATITDSVGVGQAPTIGPAITGAAVPGGNASEDSDGNPGPTLSQKNNNAASKLSQRLNYHRNILYIFALLLFFR